MVQSTWPSNHLRKVSGDECGTLRERLNRQPFEPFEIRHSDGQIFQVRHPEVVAVLKTKIAIGDPVTQQFAHVALIHINSIQALQIAS